jgi:DNA-binding NarL/FixJ family response regulator
MFDDDESVFAAVRAGARGYVLKGAAPDNVIRAIAAVAAGEAIFGPGVARRALAYLSGPREDHAAFPELTPRERQVLDLIAAGLGNAAIAARLGLATATVGNHITSIFGKLQVASRAEAIIRARSAGLGDDR